MPGNRVMSGVLTNVARIPIWVTPPHTRIDTRILAYVRMADSHGLSATLNETVHLENDHTVQGFHCYIRVSNNLFFQADLQPYFYDIHFPSSPRIFLQLPIRNDYLFTGMLHRRNSLPDNLFLWGLYKMIGKCIIPEWKH